MTALLSSLDASRLTMAAVIVVAYLACCVHFLWPRRQALPMAGEGGLLIAHASQTGFAAQLAKHTAAALHAAGKLAHVVSLRDLDAQRLHTARDALFIVSTTGEGDAPDPAATFVRSTLNKATDLSQLNYAVLALGDRTYTNFCAFGHRLDAWLREQGASRAFDVLEVDNGDEQALSRWQQQLARITGKTAQPAWQAHGFTRWRLHTRRLMNPDSAGPPCFHIELQPQTAEVRWRAGDIAEIDPHNSTWDDARPSLPRREYSIASVQHDGSVHLLVRQLRQPDGTLGLGNGWLTEQASLGADIALRIRENENFHAPATDIPMILIGNGTGIAGLRALVKERIQTGRHRNWLLFGERNAAHDSLYADEIDAWIAAGQIDRVDRVFSRDQEQRRYVQHQLLECAADLRHWVSEGAAIYVCGSLQGMAPGVDAALRQVLGSEVMTALSAQGRYRRDVY